NTADLIPKPIKNRSPVTFINGRLSISAIFKDRSAILKLPVNPYKIAIAVINTTEANILIATYLIALSILGFLPPRVMNTKEEIMTTSNHTYRLKTYHDKKAPYKEIIRK